MTRGPPAGQVSSDPAGLGLEIAVRASPLRPCDPRKTTLRDRLLRLAENRSRQGDGQEGSSIHVGVLSLVVMSSRRLN